MSAKPKCLTRGLLIGLLSLGAPASAADLRVRVDRESGIYSAGESATWTIEAINLKPNETPPAKISYKLVANNLTTLREGEISLTKGRGRFLATRETPGTLMLVIEGAGSEPITSGAAFDPQALKPSLPRPTDFDAFWAKAVTEACPPTGMFIASNQLAAPRELFVLPSAGHKTNPLNPHKPFNDKEAVWLGMLKRNIVPPTAREP